MKNATTNLNRWMRWEFSNQICYSSPENFARFVALYGQPNHVGLRPTTPSETATEIKRLAEQDAYYTKHGRYPVSR